MAAQSTLAGNHEESATDAGRDGSSEPQQVAAITPPAIGTVTLEHDAPPPDQRQSSGGNTDLSLDQLEGPVPLACLDGQDGAHGHCCASDCTAIGMCLPPCRLQERVRPQYRGCAQSLGSAAELGERSGGDALGRILGAAVASSARRCRGAWPARGRPDPVRQHCMLGAQLSLEVASQPVRGGAPQLLTASCAAPVGWDHSGNQGSGAIARCDVVAAGYANGSAELLFDGGRGVRPPRRTAAAVHHCFSVVAGGCASYGAPSGTIFVGICGHTVCVCLQGCRYCLCPPKTSRREL